MRVQTVAIASLLSIAVAALVAGSCGCGPDHSSMRKVAESKLGAPSGFRSTATLPDDSPGERFTAARARNQTEPADRASNNADPGIPIYPGAKRVVTGNVIPTGIGTATAVYTSPDMPDAVLAFYNKSYPKSVKVAQPDSVVWKTTQGPSGTTTRITVPDHGDDGMRVIEVVRQSGETLMTLMRVEPSPQASRTLAPISTTAGINQPPGSLSLATPPTMRSGTAGTTLPSFTSPGDAHRTTIR